MLALFRWWFRFKGWKISGTVNADTPRAIVIGAPHTSNWDFLFGLAACNMLNIRLNYLIKKELYFWPFSSFLNKTGAIPVDRKSSHNLVDEMVARFRNAPNMILMLSPEGTRKAVDYWKSGFYHIALGAGVPIFFGYLDYATKTAGFGPAFYPTGNTEEDLKVMRDFYKDKIGKNPSQFNLQGIRFKERRATT